MLRYPGLETLESDLIILNQAHQRLVRNRGDYQGAKRLAVAQLGSIRDTLERALPTVRASVSDILATVASVATDAPIKSIVAGPEFDSFERGCCRREIAEKAVVAIKPKFLQLTGVKLKAHSFDDLVQHFFDAHAAFIKELEQVRGSIKNKQERRKLLRKLVKRGNAITAGLAVVLNNGAAVDKEGRRKGSVALGASAAEGALAA